MESNAIPPFFQLPIPKKSTAIWQAARATGTSIWPAFAASSSRYDGLVCIRENLASMCLVLLVPQADNFRGLETCAPSFTSGPITH